MEPLTWVTVAGLLIKYGPEVADFIVQKVHAKGVVTLSEWQQVMVLANKTPQSQLADALARNGVAADAPEAQALLALLPK